MRPSLRCFRSAQALTQSRRNRGRRCLFLLLSRWLTRRFCAGIQTELLLLIVLTILQLLFPVHFLLADVLILLRILLLNQLLLGILAAAVGNLIGAKNFGLPCTEQYLHLPFAYLVFALEHTSYHSASAPAHPTPDRNSNLLFCHWQMWKQY